MSLQLDIEQRMAALLAPTTQQYVERPADTIDLSWLPLAQSDEFFIPIDISGEKAIVCVRDLPWTVVASIDAMAFRSNEYRQTYFSGEYERREQLRRAIVWVANVGSKHVEHNDANGRIMGLLDTGFTDALWPKYTDATSVGPQETAALYNSAQKYFKGKAAQGVPVPPIVIMVDYLLKGITQIPYSEFKSMTASELDRMQIVVSAYYDVAPKGKTAIPQSSGHDLPKMSPKDIAEIMPSNFFPPGHGANS